MQVCEVRLVTALWHMTLFGEEAQQASRRLLNQLQATRVIGKSDMREFYLLLSICCLLDLEDVVVEEHVKLLIGVIYAQLLEGVAGEVLKAKYVKDADECCLIFSRISALVDVIDQPGKGAGVESFPHRVPVLSGFLQLQRDLGDISTDVDLTDRCHSL